MKRNLKTIGKAVFSLLALFCVSCATGIRLNTQGAEQSEAAGTYRVIYYGCNFLNDLETIVFLDREDDDYMFDPFAPEFNYREKKGMDGATALKAAEHFLQCNSSYGGVQLRRIIGPDARNVGYELRPLYIPFTYGIQDVLDVDYVLRGDKVVITIRLDPAVERRVRGGRMQDRD